MGFSGEILSDKGHYEEFICSICVQLVDLQQSVLTGCNHVFCNSCLQEWMQRKKTCPVCQGDLGVNTNSVRYLRAAAPLAWRVLSRVRIRCPLECKQWSGDYSELQNHLISSDAHKSLEQGGGARETAMRLKDQANDKYTSRNFTDALKLYSKAIELCADIPELYGNRAVVLSLLEQHEKALEDCEAAIRLSPDLYKNWTRGSKCLISLGRFADAVSWLEKAPKSVTALQQVEACYMECVIFKGCFERAESAASKADWVSCREAVAQLLARSSAPQVLLLAARSEIQVGSIERALKLALQALRASPNNPEAYTVRAMAALCSGEADEALKYVREALRKSPDDKRALRAFHLIKRVREGFKEGREAADLKNYAQAIEAYSRVLGDSTDERSTSADEFDLPRRSMLCSTMLAERANAYFRRGEYDSALGDCARALYVQEDNKRALLTRGYVLHALGRHDEAVRDLESIVQTWGAGDAVIKGAYEKAQFESRRSRRPDYYKLLSTGDRVLGPISSELEIKSSYKQKALQCHPDKVAPTASKEERQAAEQEFKLVGEAFEVLTDSFKRKLWDEGYDKEAIEERVRRLNERQSSPHHH